MCNNALMSRERPLCESSKKLQTEARQQTSASFLRSAVAFLQPAEMIDHG